MHRFDGYDIEVTQGDTLFFTVKLMGRDLPEGSVAYFTIKKSPRSDEVLVQKKVNVTDEIADIRLYSEDTNLAVRTYYWDLRVLIPMDNGAYEVETPMEYAAFTILAAIGDSGDGGPGMDADLPALALLVEDTRQLKEDLIAARENGDFNGAPGEPGEPGEPGFSPVVEMTKEGDITTIKITDANGEQVSTVRDGVIPESVSDEEVLAYLAELDLLVTVTDGDGEILTDENDNILIW